MASSVFQEGESFDLNFVSRTDFYKIRYSLNSETLRGKFTVKSEIRKWQKLPLVEVYLGK